jgi:2-polyprenyl-6-methoxyphenol hydroxylase-like FAD-dependent oxidoreductase
MVALYAGDRPGSAFAFFMYKASNQAHIPRSRRAATLRREFQGVGWITNDLLDDADAADDIFMDTVAQIVMPKWHSGRVVLIGDACDCPTLVSGQGASLAMGGAYVLAQCLQDTSNFGAAFERYERTVRPYADSQQRAARGFVKSFIPGTNFGVALQRIVLPVLFLPAFTGLLRRQFDVRSVIEAAAS